MNSFEATLIVTGLFVLRIAFPLLLTLAFGLAMNRMLERWRTEI
jgi:hypothetical protein